ncbi:MAG: tartrate dehydrogenase [Saprospiraceae bacterium]|jgi:tartrate dehydrogenase/decarboxylase / D-malate dehydrogenase|nr:tartrate dehydrogenase [Saprospiraceae bacterium]MDP4820595.1 tartrate dehydrogenase [Saprospiraceae bacterium]MDP5000217.1 tartrate dehydrogenase [Saprospiraceae bacterium]
MRTYQIASIPGDGIGKEVLPEAIKVLEALAATCGFQLQFSSYAYSCAYYKTYGKMMADDGLERLRDSDAIFLGAVGFPGVPDHVSLWGLLIPIRRTFQQYVNLRPVRLLKGIASPLKAEKPIDFYIVRENNEGEYSSIGGRLYEGTEQEVVVQESVFTRKGVDRVMRFAFELAARRGKKIASATKSNGIIHTMPFWDERFKAIGQEYPEVSREQFHIDILCAHFVLHPDWFDVVVASNLFGDILSDLGPAVVGGMGIAAGANLNPEKEFPSMFEPVHGSAPDIAGKNVANPIACFWTAAMMLEHLGETEAAALLMNAIETTTAAGKVLTRDLGGNATTTAVTAEVIKNIGKN